LVDHSDLWLCVDRKLHIYLGDLGYEESGIETGDFSADSLSWFDRTMMSLEKDTSTHL
jgi:hypothetical protein